MDSSSQPLSTNASSPRTRELQLQGPRPAPLRVRKDSHKVRKPPIAPSSHFPQPHNNSFQQQRTDPVIIYTISPKIIHTSPDDFMTLVQRLTGAGKSSSTSSEMFENSLGTYSSNAGHISPAARYAVMDKINNSYQQSTIGDQLRGFGNEQDDIILDSSTAATVHIERSSSRNFVPSGILSPGPASLAVPNSFFSPISSDPNAMSSFFQGLSPVMNQQLGNNFKNIFNYTGNTNYQPSPGSSNLFLSPSIVSPTSYSLDLFNNLGDL